MGTPARATDSGGRGVRTCASGSRRRSSSQTRRGRAVTTRASSTPKARPTASAAAATSSGVRPDREAQEEPVETRGGRRDPQQSRGPVGSRLLDVPDAVGLDDEPAAHRHPPPPEVVDRSAPQQHEARGHQTAEGRGTQRPTRGRGPARQRLRQRFRHGRPEPSRGRRCSRPR